MQISIAMATFRGERYLQEQLESIATQSRLPEELVLTDDSPDAKTIEIAERFANNAPFPVTIVRNERQLGYRANFLKAISLCKGNLIAFCDQDDVWMRNKLERMLRKFADPDVLLAIHAVTVVDKDLKPVDATSSHWSCRGIYPPLTWDPWYLAYGMSMMVRREIFRWIETCEEDLGHDAFAWFVAGALGKIVGIREQLALYRQHDSNVFGAPQEATMPALIRRSTSTGVSHYLNSARIARGRATRFENVSASAPADILNRAKLAAAYFRTMAYRLDKRAMLYGTSRRIERFSIFADMLRSGAYRPIAQRGFGRSSLVKDLYLGLVRHTHIS